MHKASLGEEDFILFSNWNTMLFSRENVKKKIGKYVDDLLKTGPICTNFAQSFLGERDWVE